VLTCNLFLEISTWWKDQIKKAPQSSLRVHGGKWTVDQIGTCPMEARVGKGVKSRVNTRDLRSAVEQTAVAKITAVEMRIWKFF
jgi:hypothetical protein